MFHLEFDPIDFHCMEEKKHQNILQNIFFHFPQKNEGHKGLELHECE